MTVKIEFLKFHILRSQILFTSTPTPAMHIFDLFNYLLLRFLEMILIIIYVNTQTLEYIYLFFLPLWYIFITYVWHNIVVLLTEKLFGFFLLEKWRHENRV